MIAWRRSTRRRLSITGGFAVFIGFPRGRVRRPKTISTGWPVCARL